MTRLRLTKILVVVAAGLALAAGSVAAIAASDGPDRSGQRAAAQEQTRDENAGPWLGVLARPSDDPAGLAVRHVVPELQRRGLYQKDYAGATLRENLGLPRPSVGAWKLPAARAAE